jgi:hypothetical protein
VDEPRSGTGRRNALGPAHNSTAIPIAESPATPNQARASAFSRSPLRTCWQVAAVALGHSSWRSHFCAVFNSADRRSSASPCQPGLKPTHPHTSEIPRQMVSPTASAQFESSSTDPVLRSAGGVRQSLGPLRAAASRAVRRQHAAARCASASAIVCRLPPYTPDLDPIEAMWSKVKEIRRCMEASRFVRPAGGHGRPGNAKAIGFGSGSPRIAR